MNIISHMLEKKVVPIVVVSFLTLLTMGTSVMGATKVMGSLSQPNTVDKKVLDDKSGSPVENDEPQKSVPESTPGNSQGSGMVKGSSTSSAAKATPSTTSGKTGTNQALATSTTPASTNTTPATDPNACIITIFGKQYNVASLRNSHPGGDVFVCGADQSAAYQGAHGTSVSRLAPYLVTSTTQGGTSNTGSGTTTGATQGSTGSTQNGSVVTGGSSRSHREDDDDNDNESNDDNDHRDSDNDRD